MLEFNKLKKDEILSETSYFIVQSVQPDYIITKNILGQDGIKINKKYAEGLLSSANQFVSEESINQTDLINIVIANTRTAMSIYFQKQDMSKPKKVYLAEKQMKMDNILQAKVGDMQSLLSDLIDNPILDYIPGEMRLIKGYYTGTQDERGRFMFRDLEDPSTTHPKAVDPRTIEYVIVNNVKFSKKK